MGDKSVAVAAGYDCTAKGAIGCCLMLVERDDDCNITHCKAVKVDGVKVKADTAYMLKKGRVVKV
jgi:hypothetical protein